MRVIQNGDLITLEESDCDAKGWMNGNGVFETIRTVDNKPWAMSRHMRRAVSSAQQSGFRIPSEDLIRSAVEELCQSEKHPHGLLRLSFGQQGNWSAVHLPYEPVTHGAKLLTYDKEDLQKYYNSFYYLKKNTEVQMRAVVELINSTTTLKSLIVKSYEF